MVRVPGSWKSLYDLEEHVSLPELESMLTVAREMDDRTRKFQAAVQGINLDSETKGSSTFDEVKARAEAKARGMSEDEFALTKVGFAMISEDDE